MSIYEKLRDIQTEVNVEKTHENKFGGFMYRNVEDIYKAVKEIEKVYNVVLIMKDDLVTEGERAYIKATATLYDIEENTQIDTYGYAEIDSGKAKMDKSQITGSASSYAKKYALSALLLLDDTKDADSEAIGQKKIGKIIATSLHDRCKGDEELEKFLLGAMGIKKWDELINDHYYVLNSNWDKYVKAYEEKK